MAKNLANAKLNPEAEFLLFVNYSHSSSALSFKNNSIYCKKEVKKHVCLYSWDYTINHDENEDKNKKIDHIDTT